MRTGAACTRTGRTYTSSEPGCTGLFRRRAGRHLGTCASSSAPAGTGVPPGRCHLVDGVVDAADGEKLPGQPRHRSSTSWRALPRRIGPVVDTTPVLPISCFPSETVVEGLCASDDFDENRRRSISFPVCHRPPAA